MVLLSVCYNINAINTAGNFFFLHSCEAEHLTQILSPAIYVGAPLNITGRLPLETAKMIWTVMTYHMNP